jgi:hypothetical protein
LALTGTAIIRTAPIAAMDRNRVIQSSFDVAYCRKNATPRGKFRYAVRVCPEYEPWGQVELS